MKKLQKWLACFVVIVTCFAVPVTVKADMGPGSHGNEYHDYMGEKWVFVAFENYEDKDGY